LPHFSWAGDTIHTNYLNAWIGTRLSNDECTKARDYEDPLAGWLGPHGNAQRNTRGDLIIGILNQLQFRAAATFIANENSHDTWINPAMKSPFQLDHFLRK